MRVRKGRTDNHGRQARPDKKDRKERQSLNDSHLDQEIEVEEFLDIEADNNYLLLSDLSNTEDTVTQTPSTHQWACHLCLKFYTPGDDYNNHVRMCKANKGVKENIRGSGMMTPIRGSGVVMPTKIKNKKF